MSLHGARDDNTNDETLQGNFQALLAFRVNSGDKTLQKHLGAGNIVAKYNGVSSLIKVQFSKALYVPCMNHHLNLCVADTCSGYLVKYMSVVRTHYFFFSGSPKRQQHLKEKVKSLLPASKHEILINVCETTWIARLDGFDRIVELLLPVVCTIEDIAHNRKGGMKHLILVTGTNVAKQLLKRCCALLLLNLLSLWS